MQAMMTIPLIRRANIFSKAVPLLSQDSHWCFLDRITPHGLQGRLGGCLVSFSGSVLEVVNSRVCENGCQVKDPNLPAVFTQRNACLQMPSWGESVVNSILGFHFKSTEWNTYQLYWTDRKCSHLYQHVQVNSERSTLPCPGDLPTQRNSKVSSGSQDAVCGVLGSRSLGHTDPGYGNLTTKPWKVTNSKWIQRSSPLTCLPK